MKKAILLILALIFSTNFNPLSKSLSVANAKQQSTAENVGKTVTLPAEKHLRNIKQLTFGGENAEAYFSFDNQKLIFQSKRDGRACDQIYTMNVNGSNVQMISNGEGRTTCSYFFKNNRKVLYSSTF